MSVNLTKGQKISLEKEAGGGLNRVFLGLGWDTRGTPAEAPKKSGGFLSSLSNLFSSSDSGEDIDLDASCLMFRQDGSLKDVVFFGKLSSSENSVIHSGDNLTGEGEGDDERITVNLKTVPEEVINLVFTVNSFRGQSFELVRNAYVRLVNGENSQEVAKFNLSCQGPHTALIMCKLYRHGTEWKLHAIGDVANGRTFDDLIPMISNFL